MTEENDGSPHEAEKLKKKWKLHAERHCHMKMIEMIKKGYIEAGNLL